MDYDPLLDPAEDVHLLWPTSGRKVCHSRILRIPFMSQVDLCLQRLRRAVGNPSADINDRVPTPDHSLGRSASDKYNALSLDQPTYLVTGTYLDINTYSHGSLIAFFA